MRYEITLLLLLLGILAAGLAMHRFYLKRIESKVRAASASDFDVKALKAVLRLQQGSNFNALAIASWSLFFVGLVFLYFLTPALFPRMNYFISASGPASLDLGLLIFGLAIILVTSMLAFLIPKGYRYYAISRSDKRLMVPLALLLLLISIASSSYLGTIYPATNEAAWNLGYIALLASLALLMLPLVLGFKEAVR
jgi:CBS domain containing-hemolysin-like protein